MYLLRLFSCGLLLTMMGSDGASAQGPSSKPIHIVVPNPPGAATDFLGRIVARWLGERTGATVVIENRAGAGGNIALETVANAEPNGQTLLVATNGAITINRALFKKDPIDTLSDIVPIAPLGFNPILLAINARLSAQTAQEFVALARTQPGKINYGSAGVGSTPHLSVALFARLAGPISRDGSSRYRSPRGKYPGRRHRLRNGSAVRRNRSVAHPRCGHASPVGLFARGADRRRIGHPGLGG
jgi:tripartite-type tricarboxylate transporter receptor subunit TctC